MEKSIRKLSNSLMTAQLIHFCVNSYFMSKVYFGCGMMSMTDSQDKKLRKTHEKQLARKLAGKKLPKKDDAW